VVANRVRGAVLAAHRRPGGPLLRRGPGWGGITHTAPYGATVSAYLAHGVQGDERRFRGDRDRDDVVG
jgi:hypothetical protein